MAYPAHLTAFIKLGEFFTDYCENDNTQSPNKYALLENVLKKAEIQNPWFTKDNLHFALKQWGQTLKQAAIEDWLDPYEILASTPKTIAIIMAGNIPLVGFHDFVSVLLSGNKVLAKLSSNDKVLLPFIIDFLCNIDPTLADKIRFTQEKLTDFDAVIATGSNNTSRYFEYYFGKYPSIIRKNRSSVAILKGDETKEQLQHLGDDIFRYFGLGCRSVSKLFVPMGYDFNNFFEAIFKWRTVLDHHKYVNNYDYNKAIYLMSGVNMLDNEFLLLKEDKGYGSPIGTLFFEHYHTLDGLAAKMEKDKDELQCIVADGFINREVAFGHSQSPSLNDYADGVDTMEFLTNLGSVPTKSSS